MGKIRMLILQRVWIFGTIFAAGICCKWSMMMCRVPSDEFLTVLNDWVKEVLTFGRLCSWPPSHSCSWGYRWAVWPAGRAAAVGPLPWKVTPDFRNCPQTRRTGNPAVSEPEAVAPRSQPPSRQNWNGNAQVSCHALLNHSNLQVFYSGCFGSQPLTSYKFNSLLHALTVLHSEKWFSDFEFLDCSQKTLSKGISSCQFVPSLLLL